MVDRGLAETRSRARDAILRGEVTVNGVPARTAGQKVRADARLQSAAPDFASRGAIKLTHAIETFGFDAAGAAALDVGASTGGFTDVLLRRGAAKVVALDVGRGQLAPHLAADQRVAVLDGVNARALDADALPFRPTVLVFDVSFISLTLVLPPCLACAAETAWMIALVKPQFEVGRDRIGKNGIVKDAAAAQASVARIENTVRTCGFEVVGQTPSPILGGSGNAEWLIGAQRP